MAETIGSPLFLPRLTGLCLAATAPVSCLTDAGKNEWIRNANHSTVRPEWDFNALSH